MSRFSRALGRMRQDAGFSTAYAFYHRRGGRRAFPFTFAYYRKIERGEHLPRPEWISRLLDLLAIPEADGRRRELVMDFLRDIFVSVADFQVLVEPFLRPVEAQGQPSERDSSACLGSLTREQSAAAAADAAAFWTLQYLAASGSGHTAAEISEKTGFPEERVEAALKSLTGLKLVGKLSGSRWRALSSVAHYIWRRPSSTSAENVVDGYIDDMVSRQGRLVQEARIVLRAEEGSAWRVIDGLNRALEATAAHAACGRGGQNSLVALQIRARKALKF